MAAPPPPPPPPPLPPSLSSPRTKLSAAPPFPPSLPPASKVPAPPPVKSAGRANGPPPPPPVRSGSFSRTQNGGPSPPQPPPPPPTQPHSPPVPQHSPKHKAKMGSSAPPPPPVRTTPVHHTSPVPSPSAIPPPPPLRTTPVHTSSPVPSGPPPPPLHTTPIHHASPVPSPSAIPPPPPLRTTPVHTSPVSSGPPPPPLRTTPVHSTSSPIPSPSAIPPPPVLRNSMSPTHGHSLAGDNVPPPPPMRHSRHSQESPIPPPPPRRSSVTRSSINSSTPPQSPNHPHGAPPPPPTRSENTHITTVPQASPNIPPPPPVGHGSLSRDSLSKTLQPGLVLNGYGDYDIPRPAREKNGFQDYDIPLSKKEREAKEKAMSMLVPGPQLHSSPVKQNSLEKEAGLDYSTSEDKGRKEKSYSLLTTQQRLTSESSSDSRPVSVTSSVYSADASSSSQSLNSSRCSSKLTIPKDDDYDIPKPSQHSESTLDSQFEESIDQIFESMADQKRMKKAKNGGSPPDTGEPYHLQTSARSSFSNEENSSSRSGSNDNLGVWDDISYEEETEEEEEEEEEEENSSAKEVEDNGGNLLLDSWIKELESGMKGMEEVAGLVEPPTPVSVTNEDAEEVATPIQRVPPEQPADSNEDKTEERRQSVVKRRRTSKTEAEMARIATWRVSMKAIEDADDPDLDALLADLCQLEEDTKAQLASSTTSTLETGGDRRTINLGEPKQHSRKETESGMLSSEDFVQFMEGLQASKNIIPDVSGSLSMAMYSTEQTRGAAKEDSPEIPQFDKESFDIFMGDTPAILRQNSRASMVPRQSSIPKQNSRSASLRRNSSRRPGDASAGPSQGNSPQSPSHKAVKKQLDAFAEQLTIDESLTPEQQVQKLKNEKLKIAMMKLKEASVQKMVLKVHNVDGSTKMVAIHQGMNARDVCILLAERNHQDLGPNWTLVEKLTDLHLERILEDHEKVLDCLVHWPRGHNNIVLFKNNPEKYYLLKRPQMLMPASHSYSSVNTTRTTFTEEQKKNIILKELFKNNILPKLEGELHIRDGKKSSWKKHLFVLRASGLYFSKSGKSLSSKDIMRVAEWKDVECYTGTQYKKFYRAPGNYCFSLVPHGPLNKIEKGIIHLCVPTKHDLAAWMTGIRLAKHGVQLQQNYEDTKGEMPWLQLEDENLDMLARKVPEAKPRESKSIEAEPVVLLQNGKEINPQDLATKKKGNAIRGSFQLKVTENGTAKAPETLRVGSSGGHSISGPLLQEPQTGSMRRNRSNQSILASAFQNAWKQGTMAAEMSQDTEKWPVFNQPASKQKAKSHETLKDKDSLPYVEEEMSGMFTLKRKKDKDKQERNGSIPSASIPRTASLGSHPADSSDPKSRMSQTSIQTTLF